MIFIYFYSIMCYSRRSNIFSIIVQCFRIPVVELKVFQQLLKQQLLNLFCVVQLRCKTLFPNTKRFAK